MGLNDPGISLILMKFVELKDWSIVKEKCAFFFFFFFFLKKKCAFYISKANKK